MAEFSVNVDVVQNAIPELKNNAQKNVDDAVTLITQANNQISNANGSNNLSSTSFINDIIQGSQSLSNEVTTSISQIALIIESANEFNKEDEDGGFLDWLGDLGSTVFTGAGAVVQGLAEGVEGIVDGLTMLGGTVVSWGGSLVDAITGFFGFETSFGKDIRDWAKNQVSKTYVKDAVADFYTNTKVGQTIARNSWMKYDGTAANIISGIGKWTGIAAATVATGGAAGAAAGLAVGTGIAATSGLGEGAQDAYNEGASYYGGLGSGVVNGAIDGALAYFTLGGSAAKGAAKGAIKGGTTPLLADNGTQFVTSVGGKTLYGSASTAASKTGAKAVVSSAISKVGSIIKHPIKALKSAGGSVVSKVRSIFTKTKVPALPGQTASGKVISSTYQTLGQKALGTLKKVSAKITSAPIVSKIASKVPNVLKKTAGKVVKVVTKHPIAAAVVGTGLVASQLFKGNSNQVPDVSTSDSSNKVVSPYANDDYYDTYDNNNSSTDDTTKNKQTTDKSNKKTGNTKSNGNSKSNNSNSSSSSNNNNTSSNSPSSSSSSSNSTSSSAKSSSNTDAKDNIATGTKKVNKTNTKQAAKISELKEKNKDLRGELKEIKEASVEKDKQYNDQINEINKANETAKNDLKESYENRIEEINQSHQDELESQKTSYENEINTIKEENASQQTEINNLNNKISELEQQNSNNNQNNQPQQQTSNTSSEYVVRPSSNNTNSYVEPVQTEPETPEVTQPEVQPATTPEPTTTTEDIETTDSDIDVIKIDKPKTSTTTTKSSSGSSAIPIGLGVAAAGAAAVAGTRYIKNKNNQDDYYDEDMDQEDDSESYVDNESTDTSSYQAPERYRAGSLNKLVLDENDSSDIKISDDDYSSDFDEELE